MESAFSFSDTIIIQEFIPGDEYRILVIGDQVALGMRRVPAHVVGDGIQTIEELICQENKNPLRAPGYGIDLSHIPMNENTITYLQRHGLTLSSIPQNGEKIQLTSVSNL
jgi:glutamate--cysteine ligase